MIIGGFPGSQNKIGGETIKNLILANKLKEMGYNLKIFDTTFDWRKNKIKTSIKLFWQIYTYRPSHILLSVASTGAIPFLRRVNFFKKILRFKLLYLVIGGTIGEKVNKNLKIKRLLNYCDKIFVETLGLKKELNNAGINNVIHLPNFKNFSFTPNVTKKIFLPLKIFFFSRVCREKGIELAVDAVKTINNESGKTVLVLDIYGPIEKGYELGFEKLLKSSKNLKYKGIISTFKEETYNILSGYDLMIFPTYHSGEGFPGALVDSFIAGVPILASDWRYNSEIVSDGKTGRLFKAQKLDGLIEKLKWFIEHPEKIIEMKFNCIKEAKKYHINYVISKLLSEINTVNITNSFKGKI